MRAFSKIMQSEDPPGIDLPGIDFVSLAAGFGCAGVRVSDLAELSSAMAASLDRDGPYLIEIEIDPDTGAVY